MDYEVIQKDNVRVGDKIVNRDNMICDEVTGIVRRDGQVYALESHGRIYNDAFILRPVVDLREEKDDRVTSVYFPRDREDGILTTGLSKVSLRMYNGQRWAQNHNGYPLYFTWTDERVHWTPEPTDDGVLCQPHSNLELLY